MIRLIKSSIILLGILLAILTIVQVVLPYYWGSELTVSRFQVNRNKIAKSDVLFFGSSRTLYHIHGRIFSKKTNTKAYNLGIQQGRLLEVDNQIRSFVNEFPNKGKKKQIIYELCALERLQPKVMHTNRIRHFWNFDTMTKAVRYNLISNDYEEIGRCVETFLEYVFKVDLIKEYFLLHKHRQKVESEEYYGAVTIPNCRGCVMNGNNAVSSNKKATAALAKKLKRVNEYYKPNNYLSEIQEQQQMFYIERIAELKDYIESKGYEMIIMNQTGPLQMHVKLLETLKTKGYKTIEMGNPNKYPGFYDPDYLFDAAHLTRKGAMMFTEALVKEYQAL